MGFSFKVRISVYRSAVKGCSVSCLVALSHSRSLCHERTRCVMMRTLVSASLRNFFHFFVVFAYHRFVLLYVGCRMLSAAGVVRPRAAGARRKAGSRDGVGEVAPQFSGFRTQPQSKWVHHGSLFDGYQTAGEQTQFAEFRALKRTWTRDTRLFII